MNIEKKKWLAVVAAGLLLAGGWATAQDDDELVDETVVEEAVEADVDADVAEDDAAPAVAVKPRPAEIKPLTSRSLLLDVTQAGDGLVAVGDRGSIILSSDGKTWTQVNVPVRATLTAVYFADASNGWVVGHDATILRSSDGGKTWKLQHFEPALEKALLDIYFLDTAHGFAVGAYGLLYETTDGGDNWNEVDSPIREEELHFNAIGKLNNGDLFIAGEQGTLAISSDSGATWSLLESPYEGSFFGVLARGERGALIYGLRGNVYVADDARTGPWLPLPVESQATFFGGARLADNSVTLVGLAGSVRRIAADGAVTQLPVAVKEVDAHGKERTKELAGSLSAVIPFADGLLVVGENGVVQIAAGL